ncbi:MAG: polymer-forming cytoskeletal protein [Chloroflexi bacterium]|nr:MAG: polymer-forming cytoskeletal protein [Chloroflexota bacterium]
MRLLRLLALVALILALTPTPAAAADIRSGQDITIGTTETIEDDLYAFGTNIAINGTIHGDLIAGGNNISVDGNVTGDVIAGGNSVVIRGQVGGSVRAAGNTVVVDGKIANDLVVGGNELTILGNGRVGRDVIVGATNATISGQIGRDLQAGGANVKIDSGVGGNVTANVERLQITDRGTVGGSLKYTSKNEAQIANAASVKGSVERQTPDNGRAPLFSGTAALVVEWLKGLIGLLILGILVVFFFPGFSRRAGEVLVHSPWLTLAVGALALIGLPILSIVFFAVGYLIGGWWIGFVVLALFVVVLALSIPVAAVGVGGALLRVARRPVPVWLALFIGLVALLLVALIPILGGIVIFCALLFGMGATTIAVVGGRRAEPVAA